MRPDEAILTLWQNLLMKMVWNNYFSRDLSWRDCLQLKSQIQKPLAHDVVVVQLLSCVQLFVTPWLYSTPGFPVLHYLPVFTQIYVHWISDVIRPSHPLSPPSPFAFNLSQHQSFPMSQLFTLGGQGIGPSASAFHDTKLTSVKLCQTL